VIDLADPRRSHNSRGSPFGTPGGVSRPSSAIRGCKSDVEPTGVTDAAASPD